MTAETTVVRVAPGPGSSRGRWLVALGITGLAAIVTIAALLVLGGRQTPEALRYVPADAVVVAELRLDLPGDQLQKVGNLLAHFPGFADQSTLAQKLDEAGDRLVGLLSNGGTSYTGDLKPWVSGPVYAAFRGVGTTARLMPRPNGLVIATTNGAVGCDELFEDRTTTSESYRGFEIQVLGTVLSGGAMACVGDGRYVLAGDLESVKAGLGAHADGDGIAASDRYLTARAALAGDQLATLFVGGDALERLGELSGAFPTAPAIPFGASLPDWSIMGVRAVDDALIVDSVSSPLAAPSAAPSLLSLAPGHASELTRYVPGSAIAYAEVQGAGAGVVNALTLLRAEPAFAPPLAELEQILATFGGADELLGWASDAGVVIVADESDEAGGVSGGVLLLAADEATAEARVATFRGLLAVAVLGGVAELETSMVGSIEVTTATIQLEGPLTAHPVEFSFALRDRLVVVGTDADFLADILFPGGGRSLAEVPEYRTAVARGLSTAQLSLYVSIDVVVSLARANPAMEDDASFDTEIQQYLGPIDAVLLTAFEAHGASRMRIVMTVSSTPVSP
jgi:hypothetical protein